jgi:hypothetical protein
MKSYGGVDPRFAKISSNGLGDFLILQVAIGGGAEDKVESFGVAGFGQKLFSLFGIVRVRFNG